MPDIVVEFSGPVTAEFLVAGLPAAARAAAALSILRIGNDVGSCAIVADGWIPSPGVIEECGRLAPGLAIDFESHRAARDVLSVSGEAFISALSRGRGSDRDRALAALLEAWTRPRTVANGEQAHLAELRRAGRGFVAATGKSGDGLVSRYLNRPISRAISGTLLAVPGIVPIHATLGTAFLAIAMALSLVLGGGPGLIAGALLFQAASIFDGVDGEIARATHRASDRGAMIDSVIDALTNLAFVAGVAINLSLRGDTGGAIAGAMALVMLATGLLIIGRRARATGEPVNFDGIKRHFRDRGRSPLVVEFLIALTMRDFFAAACTVMILVGWAHEMLFAFAVVTSGWLLVTTIVVMRDRRLLSANNALTTGNGTANRIGRHRFSPVTVGASGPPAWRQVAAKMLNGSSGALAELGLAPRQHVSGLSPQRRLANRGRRDLPPSPAAAPALTRPQRTDLTQ